VKLSTAMLVAAIAVCVFASLVLVLCAIGGCVQPNAVVVPPKAVTVADVANAVHVEIAPVKDAMHAEIATVKDAIHVEVARQADSLIKVQADVAAIRKTQNNNVAGNQVNNAVWPYVVIVSVIVLTIAGCMFGGWYISRTVDKRVDQHIKLAAKRPLLE
jgi:hypothetical protein